MKTERLTKKVELDGKGYINIAQSCIFDEDQQCIDKLGQKEDDDEELGIDSHIVFKAVKQGYIYIKGCLEDKNRICKVSARLSQGWNTLRWSIPQTKEVKMYCYGNARYFEGYGRTWALTRDELEK